MALTKIQNEISDISKASEIPNYCIRVTKTLIEQPLFNGEGGPIDLQSKLLELERDKAKICEIFSGYCTKILGKDYWLQMYAFWGVNDQRFYSNGTNIKNGIELWISDEMTLCSFKDLKKAYDLVLSNFQDGWIASTIENNEDIMFKEDPNQFALFVKEKQFVTEDSLIRSLSTLFGTEGDIKSHGEWSTHPGYRYTEKVYMWIRITAFDVIIDKFGFNIQQ